MRGKFVTLEGVEGCGKTTQAARLASSLRERGIEVLVTREPGGSPIGGPLRQILLSEAHAVAPRAELLLYAAERAEHVEKVIRPALERGEWVVCDRYGDATRAYQAFGRSLPREAVEAAQAIATGGLEPDLTLLLRLPLEESLARARARIAAKPDGLGRFEAEAEAFHRRVAEGYEALAEEFPMRIHTVDATGSVEEVAARVLRAVEECVGG
jgi:dTMP kinase